MSIACSETYSVAPYATLGYAGSRDGSDEGAQLKISCTVSHPFFFTESLEVLAACLLFNMSCSGCLLPPGLDQQLDFFSTCSFATGATAQLPLQDSDLTVAIASSGPRDPSGQQRPDEAASGWSPPPPPPGRTTLSGLLRAGWSCWRMGPGATPRHLDCIATRLRGTGRYSSTMHGTRSSLVCSVDLADALAGILSRELSIRSLHADLCRIWSKAFELWSS